MPDAHGTQTNLHLKASNVMPRSYSQMKPYLAFLLLIPLISSFADSRAKAEDQLVSSEERAIEIGNKEIIRMNLILKELGVHVNEGNKQWNEYMAILRDSPVDVLQKEFRRYEKKLRGHAFWSLIYRPKRVEGRGFKGGGATVLVDKTTGQVLIAIREQ